jgi:hypothetical protein
MAGTSPMAVPSSSTNGDDATRIDRAISVAVLLTFAEINRNQSNFETLLREEYAHTPGIG